MTAFDKKIKIAIIGAGPAGLSAAECLKEMGYEHITVFEKLDRAGGMSLSFKYLTSAGKEIIYEQGSLQPTSSKYLSQLIKKYHLQVGKYKKNKGLKIKIFSLNQNRCLVDYVKYLIGYDWRHFFSVVKEKLTFLIKILKFKRLSKPGFSNISNENLNELSFTFNEWLAKNPFKTVGEELRIAESMANFCNAQLSCYIPQLVFIKVLMNLLKFPQRYINGEIVFIKEGYQTLWSRAAKEHHIIFNADVSISRDEGGIKITTKDKGYQFDKLIITSSLTSALNFLDVSSHERELFSKVNYCSGWRAAFLAKNMPHDAFYFLAEPYLEKDYARCALSFYPEGQVDDATWLYSALLNLPAEAGIENALQNSEKIFKEYFGATDIQWINQCYWPEYGPYFSAEETRNHIYDKLEALQGVNNTYYLGGTFSGGAQAIVIDYTYDTLHRFF